MVDKLAQEQCLGLRQGRGGQQGSGSLAALLQAWGLCSRGETVGKKCQFTRPGHALVSHRRLEPASTHGMSCGGSQLPTKPPQNLTSTSPPKTTTVSLQPIPSCRQAVGHVGNPGSAGHAEVMPWGSRMPSWEAASPIYALTSPQIRLYSDMSTFPLLAQPGREHEGPSCSPGRGCT